MRGSSAPDNSTRVSPNGYHYTKHKGEWRLTHHILAEKKLGRPLQAGERVVFLDRGKTCLELSNIDVVPAGTGSLRRRLAVIEARIEELEAEKDEIEKKLRRK